MEPTVPVAVGVAMAVATVVTLGVVLTGNGQALCDRMGGTYTPNVPHGQNVCPGGSWANLFSTLPPKPAPEKK